MSFNENLDVKIPSLLLIPDKIGLRLPTFIKAKMGFKHQYFYGYLTVKEMLAAADVLKYVL